MVGLDIYGLIDFVVLWAGEVAIKWRLLCVGGKGVGDKGSEPKSYQFSQTYLLYRQSLLVDFFIAVKTEYKIRNTLENK